MKTKKLLSLLLALIMVFAMVPAAGVTVFAESTTYDENTKTITFDGTGSADGMLLRNTVKAGFESYPDAENVVVTGYTQIQESSFEDNTKIKSAVLGEGIVGIGSAAFSCCSSLESVSLPDTLMKMSQTAFYSCTSLKSVTIPRSVIEIQFAMFYGCSALKSVEFKGTVGGNGSGIADSYMGAYMFTDVGTEDDPVALKLPSNWEYSTDAEGKWHGGYFNVTYSPAIYTIMLDGNGGTVNSGTVSSVGVLTSGSAALTSQQDNLSASSTMASYVGVYFLEASFTYSDSTDKWDLYMDGSNSDSYTTAEVSPDYIVGLSTTATYVAGDTITVKSVEKNCETVTEGNTIQATATKEGYTFAGWYTEKEGGTKVTVPTADQTLYAHWTSAPEGQSATISGTVTNNTDGYVLVIPSGKTDLNLKTDSAQTIGDLKVTRTIADKAEGLPFNTKKKVTVTVASANSGNLKNTDATITANNTVAYTLGIGSTSVTDWTNAPTQDFSATNIDSATAVGITAKITGDATAVENGTYQDVLTFSASLADA